ncbi:unnamed protein product [Brassica oleracea]
MASILSTIIFVLLFIIFSLFVDAHMEHLKLSGAKETMTMRRNLEGNSGSKITASPSRSHQSGQKNTQNEPSKTQPDQASAIITGYVTPDYVCTSDNKCKQLKKP